jgi:nicotinamidase-related amidase
MIDLKNCCLVVVDVQGKLAQLMYDNQTLFKNIEILIKAAKVLSIPVIWCQQVPEALGPTIPQIAELLSGDQPINKSSFSCCGDEQFIDRLNTLNCSNILLCGIETHVCIYQTALGLMAKSKYVTVVADAVSSRTPENKQLALNRMKSKGVDISSVEMTLFELLKTAKHPQFRDIAKLVK